METSSFRQDWVWAASFKSSVNIGTHGKNNNVNARNIIKKTKKK